MALNPETHVALNTQDTETSMDNPETHIALKRHG